MLNEIIILSDIAELAVEAEMGYSSGASTDKVDPLKRPALSKIRWKSLRFSDADTSDDESAGENEDGDDGIPGTHSHLSGSFLLKRQVSGIRNQLDRWEEPIDKSYEVSPGEGSSWNWRDRNSSLVPHSLVRTSVDTEYFYG